MYLPYLYLFLLSKSKQPPATFAPLCLPMTTTSASDPSDRPGGLGMAALGRLCGPSWARARSNRRPSLGSNRRPNLGSNRTRRPGAGGSGTRSPCRNSSGTRSRTVCSRRFGSAMSSGFDRLNRASAAVRRGVGSGRRLGAGVRGTAPFLDDPARAGLFGVGSVNDAARGCPDGVFLFNQAVGAGFDVCGGGGLVRLWY